MRFFLPIVCSLLLIGCSDSAVQNETQAQPAPAASETPAPGSVQAETSAPEEPVPAALPQETAHPQTAAAEIPVPESKKAVATPVPAPKSTAVEVVDAGAIFGQKCASCHGSKGEKAALGKSQVIAQFNAQQIKDALHGYKDGTYGKEMKALMQGQAKGLNDAQIDALAKYISTL